VGHLKWKTWWWLIIVKVVALACNQHNMIPITNRTVKHKTVIAIKHYWNGLLQWMCIKLLKWRRTLHGMSMRSIWDSALRGGGSGTTVCLTVTWTGIQIGTFVLWTVVHADEAFIAQLHSEIKQQSCLTTLHWAVCAGYTFRYRET
jgi:hypothetical protein